MQSLRIVELHPAQYASMTRTGTTLPLLYSAVHLKLKNTNRYKLPTELRICNSESYTEHTKAPCTRNAESVNVEAGDV